MPLRENQLKAKLKRGEVIIGTLTICSGAATSRINRGIDKFINKKLKSKRRGSGQLQHFVLLFILVLRNKGA